MSNNKYEVLIRRHEMEKSLLEKLVKDNKSTREIAAEAGIGQTSVRYWLKKHGLITKPKREKKCAKCGETDPSKFYKKKYRCKKCHNQEVLEAGQEKRRKIIEHLGTRCYNPECSGWKYPSCFDVHHLDPSKKDPNFASIRGWSWKRILKEIAGCILLCKNCHSALHNGDITL